MKDFSFYKGKKVFVTGHTGFKGTWLSEVLSLAGAEVMGYSTYTEKPISLYQLSAVKRNIREVKGDVRDYISMLNAMQSFQPDIVLHLAAQPLVRESFARPVDTFEINVMGTVNILECVRHCDSVQSCLNVTTDKVYLNREWVWGYREDEKLDGYDPYSNSKSCSELVTSSYKKSFFSDNHVGISTARAGNVIGGGDFAKDRIIPDCIRAAQAGRTILVRNPNSTRPYQHVLEPIFAYLLIAQRQYEDRAYADSYNVGPDECDCITTGELAELFCTCWGEGQAWKAERMDGPHEANFLKLDCSKIKSTFQWSPGWHVGEAVGRTVEWTKAWQAGEDVDGVMEMQIKQYMNA